jgi:predicted dehydrogenase
MKALIAGLGSVGSRHLNNLTLLGIQDITVYRSRGAPAPVELLSKNFKTTNDYQSALMERPDFVVIANPTSFHYEFTKCALEKRIPVYLEKPVAAQLHQAKDLLKMQNATAVAVGLQLRAHPNLLQIKAWLEEGIIGSLHSIVADQGEWLPGWHPWEDYKTSYAAREELGGGVLRTQIHDLDYLQWLFGPALSVYAQGGKRTSLEVDVEDTALLAVEFASAPAHLRMDYWRRKSTRTLQVVGEKGEISWQGSDGIARLELYNRETIVQEVPDGWTRNDMFIATMSQFLKCLNSTEPPLASLKDGARALAVAESARISMQEKVVVKVESV